MSARCRLLGVTELAAYLATAYGRESMSRTMAQKIARRYPDFPEPQQLAAGPVWHERDVAAWVERHPERPSGVTITPRGQRPDGQARARS